MRIGHKLFAAMALTSVVALLLMLGFTKWTLQQGFLDYLNALDRVNHEPIVASLRDHYLADGGWHAFQNEPHLWNRLVDESPDSPQRLELLEHRPPPFRDSNMPPPSENDRLRRRAGGPPPRHNNRLTLFDARKQRVIGPGAHGKDYTYMAIEVEGETVGWLGLSSRVELVATTDLSFVTQQSRKFILFAVLLLLVSVTVASWLARHLTQPIRALATTSKRLSQGDLTARTRVRGNDEISQLTRDFNLMADSLVAGLDRQQKLLADVAHELRTPLAILRGEIEAIEDGVRVLGPQMLDSLQQEVSRLTKMVDDLHELAQWDEHGSRLDLRSVDALALGRSRIQWHRQRFVEAGLQLIDCLPDGLARVAADEARLGQVLDNVLSNSLRYTDSGGRVEVSASWQGDQILFIVDDSEPAVSISEASRIFERLYRVEPSRSRKFGGSGLGLSICRSIIEAHGGRIWAKPSPLGGLRILLTLPLEAGAS